MSRIEKFGQQYLKHLLACPGEYKIDEPANTRHNEAVRDWSKKKRALYDSLMSAIKAEKESVVKNAR